MAFVKPQPTTSIFVCNRSLKQITDGNYPANIVFVGIRIQAITCHTTIKICTMSRTILCDDIVQTFLHQKYDFPGLAAFSFL